MLGSLRSLRRFEDPALSRDPRVRAVLAGLATLEAPPARAHFRAELRAQLVAVAPRLVAEGVAGEAGPPARTALADRPRPNRRPAALPVPEPALPRRRVLAVHVARPLAALTVLVVVLGLLLGGAVFASRHALPGDALYGLKRASENVELATASGPVDKAQDLLGFAKTRASEAADLLTQSGSGSVDAKTAHLIRTTLGSGDSDVRQASRLLGSAAVSRNSGSPLDVLTDWAPGQQKRLRQLAAHTNDAALQARVLQSVALVQAAETRAKRLLPVLSCLRGADSDMLGPLPVVSCAPASPPATGGTIPSHSQTAGPHGTTAPQVGSGGTNPPVATTPQGSSASGVQTGGGSSSSPAPPIVPLPLPSISLPSPITVGSCGPTISLGPINVGIGSCGVSAQVNP
jgi:hypothetical protein